MSEVLLQQATCKHVRLTNYIRLCCKQGDAQSSRSSWFRHVQNTSCGWPPDRQRAFDQLVELRTGMLAHGISAFYSHYSLNVGWGRDRQGLHATPSDRLSAEGVEPWLVRHIAGGIAGLRGCCRLVRLLHVASVRVVHVLLIQSWGAFGASSGQGIAQSSNTSLLWGICFVFGYHCQRAMVRRQVVAQEKRLCTWISGTSHKQAASMENQRPRRVSGSKTCTANWHRNGKQVHVKETELGTPDHKSVASGGGGWRGQCHSREMVGRDPKCAWWENVE